LASRQKRRTRCLFRSAFGFRFAIAVNLWDNAHFHRVAGDNATKFQKFTG
jgi:hypothetical protein